MNDSLYRLGLWVNLMVRLVISWFQSKEDLALENLALRQQFAR